MRWGHPRRSQTWRKQPPDRPNAGAVLDGQRLLILYMTALCRTECPPLSKPTCGHLPPASARQRGSTPRWGTRHSTSSQPLSTCVAASRTLAPSPSLPAILALDRDSHDRFRACRTLDCGACPRRRPRWPRTGAPCRDRDRGRHLGLRTGRSAAPERAL